MQIRPHHEVAVVIPVYKPQMTPHEKISFRQCLHVLAKYKIAIVAPEGMDLQEYTKDSSSDLMIHRFNAVFFQDIRGYNRLMLSLDFYRRFQEFRYILIYQLDAFVFSDQLSEWCAKGYDFIGAPWIDNEWAMAASVYSSRLRRAFPALRKRLNQHVGNGGFSLRKVSAFRSTLRLLRGTADRWEVQEDHFWAFCATSYNPFFKVPGLEIALKFAFETDPVGCYARNNSQLPFGCHAWEKYAPEFWAPLIRSYGYDI